MAPYKLRVPPSAQNDLQEIADYVNTLSAAAFKLYNSIAETISSLAETPNRNALMKTPELRMKG